MPVYVQLSVVVIPTRVGVNRQRLPQRRARRRDPHARGGEPLRMA